MAHVTRGGEAERLLRIPVRLLPANFTGLNSARLSLTRLSEHLAKHDGGGESLEDYVEATYGGGG